MTQRKKAEPSGISFPSIQKHMTKSLKSLISMRLQYMVGLGFLSLVDFGFVLQHEISRHFNSMIVYFCLYFVVVFILLIILGISLWPNSPQFNRKYHLWGIFCMGSIFAGKVFIFTHCPIIYENARVPKAIFYMSIISSALSLIGFLVGLFISNISFADEKQVIVKSLGEYEDLSILDRDPNREIKHRGRSHMFRQFLWPKSDFDAGQNIATPSRVYTTIVLCLVAGIGLYISGIEYEGYLIDKILTIDQTSETISIKSGFVDLFLLWAVWTLGLGHRELSACFLSALVITFALVIWASIILIKSWRKKFLEIYYDAPTFYYDDKNVNIGGSFCFVGTMLSYMITGAIITFLFLSFIFMMLSSNLVWNQIILDHWDFWLGYFLYCTIILVFTPWIFQSIVQEGTFVKAGMEPHFKFCSIVLELLNLPITVAYGLLTFIFGTVMIIFSFFRPDLLFLPRGLQGLQFGHMVFIMNVKMAVNRYKQLASEQNPHLEVEGIRKDIIQLIAQQNECIHQLSRAEQHLKRLLKGSKIIKNSRSSKYSNIISHTNVFEINPKDSFPTNATDRTATMDLELRFQTHTASLRGNHVSTAAIACYYDETDFEFLNEDYDMTLKEYEKYGIYSRRNLRRLALHKDKIRSSVVIIEPYEHVGHNANGDQVRSGINIAQFLKHCFGTGTILLPIWKTGVLDKNLPYYISQSQMIIVEGGDSSTYDPASWPYNLKSQDCFDLMVNLILERPFTRTQV